MDLRPGEYGLQWPQPPEKVRVRHIMTIMGAKEEGISLKSIVSGKSDDRFIRPLTVAVGSDGRLGVADTGCRCVRVFIPGGRYMLLRGGKDNAFSSPVGVTFDDELRTYVSDSALGKVFVFDRNGAYLFSIGEIKGSKLQRPTGLAFNPVRKIIYVVDTEANTIYGVDKNGERVISFGGRGEENGRFNFPTYIAWSPPGRIVVSDSMNFRIQMFDDEGNFLASIGHQGDGSGDFAMPKGVAVDREGVIYVSDNLFDNVQLFNRKGEFLLTVGRHGSGEGEFLKPSGIFIDESDRLYVCDTINRRIQVFQVVRWQE